MARNAKSGPFLPRSVLSFFHYSLIAFSAGLNPSLSTLTLP